MENNIAPGHTIKYVRSEVGDKVRHFYECSCGCKLERVEGDKFHFTSHIKDGGA